MNVKRLGDEGLAYDNYIYLPAKLLGKSAGDNLLHFNTSNRSYHSNPIATRFVDESLRANNASELDSDVATFLFCREYVLTNGLLGDVIEFGFCAGRSLSFLAALFNTRKVWAFDSLNGIDHWRPNFESGTFAYRSKDNFPFLPLANTSLIIGDIVDTLKEFLVSELKPEKICFVHIDTDTYDVCLFILRELSKHQDIETTLFLCDEYYNYSSSQDGTTDYGEWENHEFKAVNEFAAEQKLNIRYLAYNANHQQVAFTFQRTT